MPRIVPEAIEAYAQAHSEPAGPLFAELFAETHAHADSPGMLSGPVEGQLLRMVARLLGARRILEIGMFTGYSALMMAEALPDDGVLITCDVNPASEAIARRFFARSPHGKKIEIRMGPALATIKTLREPLDMVFIDADKETYPAYWDAVVPRVRPGGIIAADNVLWSGRVLDPVDGSDATQAIRIFNDRVAADARVEKVMLSVRDGLTLARVK